MFPRLSRITTETFPVLAGTDTFRLVGVVKLMDALTVPKRTLLVLAKFVPVNVTDTFLVPTKGVKLVALGF